MITTDIAIIGSGPAGLAAAVEAATSGARVVLLDEHLRLGGQFFKQAPSSFKIEDPSLLGKEYPVGQKFIRLVTSDKVDLWLDSLVWGVAGDRILAIRRGSDCLQLNAEKIIVATGAYDRPVPFPGWTLPGVITAGAAQTLAKNQWMVPSGRVLLVGSGPFQLPVAHQLLQGGARIAAVVESLSFSGLLRSLPGALGRPDRGLEGLGYWLEIRRSGAQFLFGHTIIEALGEHEVQAAVIAAVDDAGRVRPGSERTVEVDTICTAFGFLPSTQVTRLLGCAERFDEEAGGFLPMHDESQETSVAGVFVAGETSGIGGSDVALAEGQLAAVAAAWQLGRLSRSDVDSRWTAISAKLRSARRFAAYLQRTFGAKPAAFERIPDDTVVCRCEEVTAGEVRRAVLDGAESLTAVKIRTRAGMGSCQGRVCSSTVATLASLASGKPVEAFGTPSIRPPIKPVRLGALADQAPEGAPRSGSRGRAVGEGSP
jgi:NADPH-dependent 2,4-dienoyl-CoA reductase/sulfur reductase-like enzyme